MVPEPMAASTCSHASHTWLHYRAVQETLQPQILQEQQLLQQQLALPWLQLDKCPTGSHEHEEASARLACTAPGR